MFVNEDWEFLPGASTAATLAPIGLCDLMDFNHGGDVENVGPAVFFCEVCNLLAHIVVDVLVYLLLLDLGFILFADAADVPDELQIGLGAALDRVLHSLGEVNQFRLHEPPSADLFHSIHYYV